MKLSLVLALLAAPGFSYAEDFLSPEAFNSYSEGTTLYFAQNGQPFGVEQYLPDRKSIWQYSDGTCVKGIWFDQGDRICFTYENDAKGTAQCWRFLQKGARFAARADGRGPQDDLEVIWQDAEPIACLAPDVGS